MVTAVLKYQYRQLKRSRARLYDFLQLLYAYIFRKHNAFISSNTYFKNRGVFKPESPFYFDILVNRATWVPSDKGMLKIAQSGSLITGKNVRISGGCRISISGKLQIGTNTFINPNSKIITHTEISIGDNCAISWNCQIMDTDMHSLVIDGEIKKNSLPIKIGNNVWIGSGCTILKGVTIGDGAVVAAGAIVTKSIPSRTLAGGSPAKIIRENIDWKP